MKKSILFILIFLLIFWISFWWFCEETASDNPPKQDICYNNPEWLEDYLSNAINIISNIKIDIKDQWPSWFWEKSWQTPVWAAWVWLFFSESWLWNFFQNFYLTFQDSYILRDWTKLTKFKQEITQSFLQASWNGILNKNIEYVKEIKQRNIFILKWDFHTYKETLKYIWENQLLLEKIFFEEVVNWWIWDIDNLDNNKIIKDIKEIIKENTKYTINEEKLKNLISSIRQSYYINWQKIECSSNWDDFIKSVHNIVCNIWIDKVWETTERFSCNYERLKYALDLWWIEWNCWSVKLKNLEKDRIKINKWQKTKEDITEFWKLIFGQIPTKLNDWLLNLFQTQKKEINKISSLDNNISNLKPIILKSNLEKTANIIKKDKNILNSVLTNIESAEFTHNTTILFPQISYKIHNIISLLWKTNNDEDTILDNTATACENQSPFDWKCRPSWN